VSGNLVERARFDARFVGSAARGRVRWRRGGEYFGGLAWLAPRASAAGDLQFDLDGDGAQGAAQATLSQARLDANAQQALRAAFPDLARAPIGPTFAAAERALDVAADRFDLVVPLGLSIDDVATRIRIAAPAEARAASGTVLRLGPLRGDAPALVMQWPGAALHGTLAIELSGGGAPTVSLLLDTVDWSPGAPFEADGTLALSNWRADTASIAADELNIGMSISPQGVGRADVRGPARITGPVGDGEVRDMVATLDVAVMWNPGWRVVPNGCVPIQLGGLDAAGLSFSNGAFSLCPLNGALIAANAQRALSGGFSIQALALSGTMAGPQAHPARLGVMVSCRPGYRDATLKVGLFPFPGFRCMALSLFFADRISARAFTSTSWTGPPSFSSVSAARMSYSQACKMRFRSAMLISLIAATSSGDRNTFCGSVIAPSRSYLGTP
jgi:hypothetical protein